MDNLYWRNGTWYVVTDDPESIPDRRVMLSTGLEIQNDEENVNMREPTDEHMKIVNRSSIDWSASRLEGTTFVLNDATQFLQHYYQ